MLQRIIAAISNFVERMNKMLSKKTIRVVTAVIAIILVLTMVIPMFLTYLI